jgi:hypothetical protein
VIASVVAFHARQAGQQTARGGRDQDDALAGYRPESLRVLFGEDR